MIKLIFGLALVALGFGLGRLKHPSNLKLSAVKAEIRQIEFELVARGNAISLAAREDVRKVIARLKSLL